MLCPKGRVGSTPTAGTHLSHTVWGKNEPHQRLAKHTGHKSISLLVDVYYGLSSTGMSR
jgi:hypothetical protein